MTALFTAWGDVANHPSEDGARTAVLQKSATLVAELHTTRANLDKQWVQTRDSLDVLAKDVNAKAAQIADLNTAIKRATQANLPVNELADKRDGLVLDLAVAIGATSTPRHGRPGERGRGRRDPDRRAARRSRSRAVGTKDPADTSASGAPRFVTDPGGMTVAVGGTAGGQLTALTTTIPTYRQSFDGVAQQLATEVNAVQTAGFDKAGAPGRADVRRRLRHLPRRPDRHHRGQPDPADHRHRRASPRPLPPIGPGPPPARRSLGDGGNAGKLAEMEVGHRRSVTYRKLIVGLGVEASVASSNLQTQTVIGSAGRRLPASRSPG